MTTHMSELLASRRDVLAAAASVTGLAVLGSSATAVAQTTSSTTGDRKMDTVTTKDGVRIFYKDLGPKNAPALVFHHGWPLSADDWDAQVMFFLMKGFRVIAHDRRGHGRSTQTFDGNEMDTYAADVAALTDALDLKDAVHIGHSTGGGEVAHYVARARPGVASPRRCSLARCRPSWSRSSQEPGGSTHRSVRWHPRCACREPRTILPRPADRSVLRLQSPRRESEPGRASTTGGARE